MRAIPLPPVARHVGATIMTPANAGVAEIFDALGTAVVVDSEPLMKKMMCVTGLMGQFYAQQRQTQAFLVAQGVDTFDELVRYRQRQIAERIGLAAIGHVRHVDHAVEARARRLQRTSRRRTRRRLRATTTLHRYAVDEADLASGFDQEAAAALMAR